MKRTSRPPGRIAAVVVALAALVACRIANEDEVSDAGADAGAAPTPKACASNQDCAGACPAGSLDCACAAMPLGLGCVPTCARTMDCPLGTTCDRQSGVCIAGGIGERDGGMMGERDAGPGPGPGPIDAGTPPGPEDAGPPAPKSCKADPDCVGACPKSALACVCSAGPQGEVCAPTCSVAADCPVIPGGPQFACNAGICVPLQH